METKEKTNEEMSDTETKRLVKLMSLVLGFLFVVLFFIFALGFMYSIVQAIEENKVGMLVSSIILLLLSMISLKVGSKLDIKEEKKK